MIFNSQQLNAGRNNHCSDLYLLDICKFVITNLAHANFVPMNKKYSICSLANTIRSIHMQHSNYRLRHLLAPYHKKQISKLAKQGIRYINIMEMTLMLENWRNSCRFNVKLVFTFTMSFARVLKLLLWPTNLYYNAGDWCCFWWLTEFFSCVDLAITLSERFQWMRENITDARHKDRRRMDGRTESPMMSSTDRHKQNINWLWVK